MFYGDNLSYSLIVGNDSDKDVIGHLDGQEKHTGAGERVQL